MKALVIEDEPLVRSELIYALRHIARGCVVAEAGDGGSALDLLKRHDYDVVFCDIRMPGMSGLEVADAIKRFPNRPPVVFVTAHEGYALEAFEVAASDYLLKPVTEERLTETLRRLGVFSREAELGRALMMGRLTVRIGDRQLLVPIEEVRFVQVHGHVVTAALYDQTARVRQSLGECSERLESHGFLRVHRAYLVNQRHVLEIVPYVGGHMLRIDDRAHSEVPVSRHFAPLIRATFG